jgi:hypothetical protein
VYSPDNAIPKIYKYQKDVELRIRKFIKDLPLRTRLSTKGTFEIDTKLVSTKVTQVGKLSIFLQFVI